MTDNIRLNLDQAFQENPDRYARDRIIGRSFGIPPRLLDDNDRSIYRAINNEKVMEGLTTARHFYSNYDNAVLAQDDSENLANIEKAARLNAVRQWGEKNRLRSNEPGIIRENAAAVWAGLRMFTNNIDLLQANYYARELERREKDANDKLTKLDPNSKEAQLIRTDLDNVRKHLRERISGNVDEYQEDVTAINKLVDENTSLDTKKALEEYDNIHDTWDTVKFFATHPRATIYTGAQSFGGMLPTTVATAAAVAAAPFTGGASLAVGAGTTALGSGFTEYNASLVSKLQEAAKDGDITSVLETPEVRQQIESEAFRRGATIGTVEGLTMGLTGVVAKFASSPLRAAVYGTGVEVAAGSIGEAAGQIADQGKITSPRDIVSEGLLEIATGAPEVGLSIAKYGKNQLAEINTADVQNLQHMAQAAQQSKLGERAPDVFEDFVRKAAEDADSSHLYIDGNALHQSGLDEALIKTDPSFTDRIAEAVETGGAVQIPLEEFLTKIAPNQDIVTRMQEHTRFQPDGLSMQEIREHAESEINDALKQAVEKAATEEVRDVRLDAVKNDILEQLNQVNRFTPETNALYAALPASFYDVYSQRAGMTIDEFLAQNAIRIVGETNDGGLNQALESHPPEGWVHAQTGEETSKLWRGDSDAKAVFWTEPAYRLSEELPQITGYSYSISADALEHIRKQHSNAETEVKRGQIGITEEDIARIPEIINNYGAVRDDLKSLQGSQRLMLAKRFEDGTIVYLVQPSRKKKDLQGVTMWKYPPAVDEQRALEIAITSNQTFKTEGGIFHKGNNTPSPETKQEGYHQAIRAETREQYERRIDELFAGGKAKDKGITILDRSDILDMFGLGDTPVRLVESKVLQGMDNHREMTAEVWKKIPDWLENPAAVFDSDTEQGRLVVIAPELVNGEAVRIILSPSRNGMDAAVVVNAYGGNRKAPYSRWMNDRLLRYADTKRAPQIDEVFGRRLPDVLKNPDFQPAAQIHGMGQGNRKSSGRTKILTEKNLAGYRKNAASLKQNSSAQNPVLERGSFLP
ncbi:MAG: hypothetical protein Q4A74_01655, partial [Cardiobacteriaceae bacterium]|nr:hypothetical protein [Cardiobacteriaceae bacterium]